MSKKNKNKEVKSLDNKELTTDVQDETVDVVNEETPEAPLYEEILVEEVPSNPIFELSDAARRFIVNYKEHWLTGLTVYLQSHGLPLNGDEVYFKKQFLKYGLSVK